MSWRYCHQHEPFVKRVLELCPCEKSKYMLRRRLSNLSPRDREAQSTWPGYHRIQ